MMKGFKKDVQFRCPRCEARVKDYHSRMVCDKCGWKVTRNEA